MPTLPRKIHIVAFDVPYPADYCGVIDIFYKVKATFHSGVKVDLHMYHYGRKKSTQKLKKYCNKLYYYKRRTFKNPFIGSTPYIVNSRNGDALLINLCKDKSPILFEGLHTTYHLANPILKDRFKIVRTHNIEHHYYKQLEKSELRYFKKYFFRIEAEKLRKYESVLKHANLIAAISPNDEQHFLKKYKNVMYLPAFHSNEKMQFPEIKEDYLLYHGNLAVPENYIAAIQLIKNVFSKSTVKCIIAGNNPPKELEKLCALYPNIELKTNISTNQIHKLIEAARINVLYTNQNTGIKLKLLNALSRGKFAVVNPLMVEGTGLENICIVGNNFNKIEKKIDEYMLLDYTVAYFENRKDYLEANFSNKSSAIKLLEQVKFKEDEEGERKSDKPILKNLSQFSLFLSFFSV